MLQFNKILDRISHNDNIGHLFIVDIKIYDKNPPNSLLFNEFYPTIFQKKQKTMGLFERSTIQLMSIMRKNEEKDKIDSFCYTSKTHSTLKDKNFIRLYTEDLNFLIKIAWWLVTHIYEHYTFKQSKFQKDLVIINQKTRQKTTSSVERDFFKLLNNSNFGIDCRNNVDNCVTEPLYDDLNEISYVKNLPQYSVMILLDTFFLRFI